MTDPLTEALAYSQRQAKRIEALQEDNDELRGRLNEAEFTIHQLAAQVRCLKNSQLHTARALEEVGTS